MAEARESVEVVNNRGLHARASAKFVTMASGFDAEVTVSHDGNSVTGTSIMGLMMLAAEEGAMIQIVAIGPDEAEVLSAIEKLIVEKFNED